MTSTVTLPLWLLILILLFAGVTFASHFLLPSVRWFFRRRAERVIARVNTRLARPIEPFKLARRHDMIQRLIYDPEVIKAVSEHAAEEGEPEAVAFEKARRYAKEIVPSFSATAYFGFGTRVSRWLARGFYRVRQRALNVQALEEIPPDSAIVFVMNHRSNMDYVLVTYLVARATSLSYAVGEWARVWPLSALIRSMGAYFIRRKSRNALYRRVLARYVQLATEGGVTQAMYPEGGLSLSGGLQPAKLGLLSYMVQDWTPEKREVVFVPVGLNYDRVIEDSFLVKANESGKRKFSPGVRKSIGIVLKHAWVRLRGKFELMGTATVVFGEPLLLSQMAQRLDIENVEAVGEQIMAQIARSVPLCAVPLVSRALLGGAERTEDIAEQIRQELEQLRPDAAIRPVRPIETFTEDALHGLQLRKLVAQEDGRWVVSEPGRALLAYYAASIAHHYADAA